MGITGASDSGRGAMGFFHPLPIQKFQKLHYYNVANKIITRLFYEFTFGIHLNFN